MGINIDAQKCFTRKCDVALNQYLAVIAMYVRIYYFVCITYYFVCITYYFVCITYFSSPLIIIIRTTLFLKLISVVSIHVNFKTTESVVHIVV